MNEPCIDCICLAVCKGKFLHQLVNICSLITDYLHFLQSDGDNKIIKFYALNQQYELKETSSAFIWFLHDE